MAVKKSLQKKCLYKKRRYWYHLSSSLRRDEAHLIPWGEDKALNRSGMEPDGERICVAPTIAHCLTALPYAFSEKYSIYRTKSPVKADSPKDVFDANVTLEGWIQKPTTFVRIGTIRLEDVEYGEGVEILIGEAASGSCPKQSGKVLKWWQKRNLWRYIKRA